MPNLRDIRRRIRSVRNTAQITRAMQMVAAARMRKAQQAAVTGRPYATLLGEIFDQARQHARRYAHALTEERQLKTHAVILISTDKGLCGALNANLYREALRFDPGRTVFIAIGRKGAQFVARTGRRLVAEFSYRDGSMFNQAHLINWFACQLFLEGAADHVDVLFSRFVTTLEQRPALAHLLPVGDTRPAMHAGMPVQEWRPRLPESSIEPGTQFAFEPSAAEVMDALLLRALDYQFYQVLLEARASEHSARMVAMKNATDSARELLDDLTLEYNKLRQTAITNEILQISSAVAAAT